MEMNDDITVRLRDWLSWPNADEAILEIQTLRVKAYNWEQTAKILAVDLGNQELANEIYEDVQDGLYDKVRARIKDGD
jgi:hypothetical protein